MRTEREKIDFLVRPESVVDSMTVDLACSAEEAYAFMWDPQSTFLLEDDVVHAVTLPGTPARQVGEIQVSVVRGKNGLLEGRMLEVLEVEPGRRATSRSLISGLEARQILEVEPLTESTCRVSQHFGCKLEAGTMADTVSQVRQGHRRILDRLGRRLVEQFGVAGPA